MKETWGPSLIQEDPTCQAHALQLLSLCPRTQEPQVLSPCKLEPCYATREARVLQQGDSPHSPQLEKSPHSSEDPAQLKVK